MLDLPADIERVCSAASQGGQPSIFPSTLTLASTTPLSDPLASLCLSLATTLTQNLSPTDRESTGIILATQFGCLQTDIEFDISRREAAGRYASPALFRSTLPSMIAGDLSVQLGIRGPIVTLLPEGPDTETPALQRAVTWMRHLDLPFCLTGTFDSPPGQPPQASFHLLRLRHGSP